ncbi:hypothetical protein L1987_77960 [Smallanthus sonchifolius]|uniref:Uncharacterized protein n=1 Tax=Smallanthus sonchifolius TaxID=185202 RepID=A0ACB8ZCD8_9ASTR|nr:hypothetical protein L1987_77960 [Smallanthus sonchifolius]
MVEDPATDSVATDSVVSWSRGRNSFVVWDSHKFSTTLLPMYFKHSNFSSFIRQLNTCIMSEEADGGKNIPPLSMVEFVPPTHVKISWIDKKISFSKPSEVDEVLTLFCKFISEKAPKFCELVG